MGSVKFICLIIVLAPLAGCLLSGFGGQIIGRKASHRVTIAGLGLSFAFSLWLLKLIFIDHIGTYNAILYHWGSGGHVFDFSFNVGFLIDNLSAVMIATVTFVSLLVHIYSIGYMAEDPGYQRFFSYISLFTFFMLMLVSANNFLQLFFGWEGVGLASYLLIGFWYKREAAIAGSLKAFIVNRVGDFGFILGIALVLAYAGSLDYNSVFKQAADLSTLQISIFPGSHFSVVTVICILLFVGAMGKSAQMPLHVWLPASMEGPTPISALIHAATMVTAGVFMVARMSPMYEYSDVALNFIMIIGATGALFTGLMAVVMTDIKRVIAYSTLSQLGYMMVAMGASAYSVGIFHLVTHACFKAALFLAAGSVIIAMHHQQDMRKMGGLWRFMPITYIVFFVGNLALAAIPPFAGFYSKDSIIEVAKLSQLPGAGYAYFCVSIGAFVTGVYAFRSLFLTFHGKPRMDEHTQKHLKESPWVVWLPLVALAIPSIIIGAILVGPMLFTQPNLLGSSVFVLSKHNVLSEMAAEYHGPIAMATHAIFSPTFWLATGGIFVAWIAYIVAPKLPEKIMRVLKPIHTMLINKYGFDLFNEKVFVRGGRATGRLFSTVGDRRLIDGLLVNGSGYSVRWLALRAHLIQSGYLYHYASVMVLGLLVFLAWLLL